MNRKESKRRKYKFINDKKKYNNLLNNNEEDASEFEIRNEYLYPIMGEDSINAGLIDGHYFLQDIYFAKMIAEQHPDIHYDIGSRIDGFIAHLLSNPQIGEVCLLDIRPFPIHVEGLHFLQTDATKLYEISDNSIMSISSLHAIEHFGLGRYGDDIDPDGWKKSLHAIQKKIKIKGRLYLGLPLGKPQRLCFNAHRLFAPSTIIDCMRELELISFSYIHDYKIYNVEIQQFDYLNDIVNDNDCGLFIFKKK